MECPICGCQDFFVKDPEDEYETHEFSVAGGRVEFQGAEAGAAPDVQDDTRPSATGVPGTAGSMT